MTPPRRPVTAACLLGGLLAAAQLGAMSLDEPLDLAAGACWSARSPELVIDPVARELRASRTGIPAWFEEEFETQGPEPQLRLDYEAVTSAPGDNVRVEVGWEGAWLAVPEPALAVRTRRVDLTPYLREAGSVTVRLVIEAAGEARRVAARRIVWEAQEVERVAPCAPGLPPACWMAPVEMALHGRRIAPGRAPDPPVDASGGRIESRLPVRWRPLADGAWLGSDWTPGRLTAEQVLLAVATPGAQGGTLTVDGHARDGHQLGWLPLGARLERPPAGSPWPDLELAGVAVPASHVSLRRTGPLALRHVAARLGADGLPWLDVVIDNQSASDRPANLRATVAGQPVATAGCTLPPGVWLLPLALPRGHTAAPADVTLTLDDGTSVQDTLVTTQGRQLVGPARRTLRAPVDPAALDDREPVAIVVPADPPGLLAAERLLFGSRPNVVSIAMEAVP